MSFPRRHHFKKKDHGRPEKLPDAHALMQPEHTGSETAYLKSLIDSRAKVTVVLDTGEQLRGRIRYYDRECFSIGPSSPGPKLFIRKTSVAYIAEDQDA